MDSHPTNPEVSEDLAKGNFTNPEEQSEDVPFMHSGRTVVYCPVCTLPPEYCEFNPKKVFNQCKPWLLKNYPDMYPQLKAEEEKRRKKDRRPKGTFHTWYDIGLFHNVRAGQLENKQPITYRGKIKLHGTNVAVSVQHNGNQVYIQSRNTFLTRESDHHGFAAWALASENKQYFKSLFRRSAGYRSLTVFGEWCGKGIMKGAAICKIDQRLFAVFAVLLDKDRLITSPSKIEEILKCEAANRESPKGLVIIPFVTDEVQLIYGDKEQLLPKVEEMNRLVERIDAEDPWVKQHFGVSGTGEGLVWYPFGFDQEQGHMPLDRFRDLVFKTKGPTHTMVSCKRSIQIAPEVLGSAEAFIHMFVTPQRLTQGWEEMCQKGRDEEQDPNQCLQRIGDFVQWVCKDVEKESTAELKESNLTWGQVSGLVNVRARKWFLAEINRRGGVTTSPMTDDVTS